MAKDETTFQLDIAGAGKQILEELCMPLVRQSGLAIQARAQSMANSMSEDPPSFELTANVGTIKRGARAIATIKADTADPHQEYIARQVLAKSKDAGRVN